MGRKTQKAFGNTFIMKGSSIMHLAMVPRFIWRGDIFHHLLKCFKMADLLYTHYLLFYSPWWVRIFLFCKQHHFLLYTAMYDKEEEEEGFGKGVGDRQLVCQKQQKPPERRGWSKVFWNRVYKQLFTDRQPRSVYECNGTSCSTSSK